MFTLKSSETRSSIEKGILWYGGQPIFFDGPYTTVAEIIDRFGLRIPQGYTATINGQEAREQTVVELGIHPTYITITPQGSYGQEPVQEPVREPEPEPAPVQQEVAMPKQIYTARDLMADLQRFDPSTPVIAQTCCFEQDGACGGIQVSAVLIDANGAINPAPDELANGIALEVINKNA